MKINDFQVVQQWNNPETGEPEALMRGIDNPNKLCLAIERAQVDSYIVYSMDTQEMSYMECDKQDSSAKYSLSKNVMEQVIGEDRVNRIECLLENVACGIVVERVQQAGLMSEVTPQSSQPLQKAKPDPQVEHMFKAIAKLSDPKRFEYVANSLWSEDWPAQDKGEWISPKRPAHNGPAPTACEMLEQKDDVVRFYEQQHTNGERARLFAFNAETGESLTWEWDAKEQQPHIEDPHNMLDSLKQHNHWQGMEAMINEKAKELVEPPAQNKPISGGFTDRLTNENKGAQLGR